MFINGFLAFVTKLSFVFVILRGNYANSYRLRRDSRKFQVCYTIFWAFIFFNYLIKISIIYQNLESKMFSYIITTSRVWLTTESNKEFPIGLLQMSLKFTNEPPQGIRASLKRTYADVTQDTLDYSNHPSWPSLLYSVAFLHTVVQVRFLVYYAIIRDGRMTLVSF